MIYKIIPTIMIIVALTGLMSYIVLMYTVNRLGYSEIEKYSGILCSVCVFSIFVCIGVIALLDIRSN